MFLGGCPCCGKKDCWRCYRKLKAIERDNPGLADDDYDYQCLEAPPDEDGWEPVGKCHPDEESCAKECPPIEYECDNSCDRPYRLSGYPLGEALCADDGRFIVGQPYTGLGVSGDLSPAFLITNYEYDGRAFPWKLEAESPDANSNVVITGGCGTTPGSICAYANGLITLRPFAGLLPSDPPLKIRFNSYDFNRYRESAVVEVRLDTDPFAPSNPKFLVRSVELGGNVLAQPVDATTSSFDTNLDLRIHAQNGQTTQLFNSACIVPENWRGDLVLTVEAWSVVAPSMPSDYTLLARKIINVSWPDMINVYTECVNAPCVALPVWSCLYKDYEFQSFQYTSLDELPEGWVLDFNAPSYTQADGASNCAECCGGLEEDPDRGFATGHTLFNNLEQNPIKLGDPFVGTISGSMVDGLTGLRCVEIDGDTYKFADDPETKIAAIESSWVDPIGQPVSGYKCSVVSPYIPNILENPDGTPLPVFGEYDTCDECDKAIQGNPVAPDSCVGDAEASKPTPQYTAEVTLSPTCRASSVVINFADIQPLTYIDRGPGLGFIPGGPHPFDRYTMASCTIGNSGIYVGRTAAEDTGRWIKAEFAGRTLGGPDKNAEQIGFSYCPVDPSDEDSLAYVPQDEFSGELKITVGWDGGGTWPDSEWEVTIKIDGVYDSYCWMCGVDNTLNHVVSKPSLPSPYDPGDDARPITRSTTGGRTMPTTTTGPGTELANLLKMIGINPKEKGCSCKSHAKRMDKEGPQWCRDNIETILGWLQTESKKRKLPFIKQVAKQVVLLAIRRAEKKP